MQWETSGFSVWIMSRKCFSQLRKKKERKKESLLSLSLFDCFAKVHTRRCGHLVSPVYVWGRRPAAVSAVWAFLWVSCFPRVSFGQSRYPCWRKLAAVPTADTDISSGSCHKYHFCRDTHVFVATKRVFCRDKSRLAAANVLSRQFLLLFLCVWFLQNAIN